MKVVEISIVMFDHNDDALGTEYIYTDKPEGLIDRKVVHALYQMARHKTLNDARFIWHISRRIDVVEA